MESLKDSPDKFLCYAYKLWVATYVSWFDEQSVLDLQI
jgi:hypothetical protein